MYQTQVHQVREQRMTIHKNKTSVHMTTATKLHQEYSKFEDKDIQVSGNKTVMLQDEHR